MDCFFKNRKGIKYEFDNEEEYKKLVEPEEPAPFWTSLPRRL